MTKIHYPTIEEDLKERLKDPEFRKAWEETEAEYQLSRQLIKNRLTINLSQRDLARKVHTSAAQICRIETMSANPSLNLLKRIATSLNLKLKISFQ